MAYREPLGTRLFNWSFVLIAIIAIGWFASHEINGWLQERRQQKAYDVAMGDYHKRVAATIEKFSALTNWGESIFDSSKFSYQIAAALQQQTNRVFYVHGTLNDIRLIEGRYIADVSDWASDYDFHIEFPPWQIPDEDAVLPSEMDKKLGFVPDKPPQFKRYCSGDFFFKLDSANLEQVKDDEGSTVPKWVLSGRYIYFLPEPTK